MRKMRGVIAGLILIAMSGAAVAQNMALERSAVRAVQNSANQPDAMSEVFGDPAGAEQPQPIVTAPAGGDILLQQQSGMRTDIPNAIPDMGGNVLKPYGSQIFTNSTLVDRSVGVNPDYAIAQGDRIAVRMWGARTFDGVLVVDIQGNIFLPEIGPIKVEGITNDRLAQRVRASVAQVYTDNVKVYTNLLGTQPLGVFVTGAVPYPGRYPGAKDDSVLYYLARAGGIDPQSGSYRDIRVMRDGRVVATVDLYDFLTKGAMPNIRFSDNDVIVVGNQFPTVWVSGQVRNEYLFEFLPHEQGEVSTILRLAQPQAAASHVLIQGIRDGKHFNTYVPLSEIENYGLADGDAWVVDADREAETIVVKVDGNDLGPSTFAVPRSTRLGAVAQLIEVDPDLADLEAIYIRRESVAQRQRLAIDRALYELQRSVLTDNSISGTESQIRVQEAALVERFVAQVRAVAPEGRVVLAGSDWKNMILENGDEIVIPKKSDVVVVSGEVKLPQTVLWKRSLTARDYINAAGGLSNRGDASRLLVMRNDGSVHDGSAAIRKGDHIMVLPSPNAKTFAIFRDVVEVLYRVALSTAVVLNVD
ncbi:polysaccharide biosynthesis/export family protein [Parvibaculum sp.]|jgi:protein involved in polysaccharide export with SLBB domain|uniref:polysaccharide biosynthesis/export family protein n=1 Tax=Parvibaculum sp. TaxID=2024848 RepID=UPI003C733438